LPSGDRRVTPFASDNFLRKIFQDPGKTVSEFLSAGDVAADLGCGPGFYTLPMARLVGPEEKVFAVDFDERAIETVKRRAGEHGLEGVIDPRVSSAADIGFIPEGSVDFVLAEGLLCCMVDHAGAVEQIKRVLKKDGRVFLRVSMFGRRSDPRTVTKEEWQKILGSFRLLKSGQGLSGRWAVVTKVDGEPGHKPMGSSPGQPDPVGCFCG
jgi:ubiquinone/menaquinone biosynthesis C-methylase UbiE